MFLLYINRLILIYLIDLKFENNKLKQDAQTARYDLDHLTKIVEESDFIIRSVKEKVNNNHNFNITILINQTINYITKTYIIGKTN